MFPGMCESTKNRMQKKDLSTERILNEDHCDISPSSDRLECWLRPQYRLLPASPDHHVALPGDTGRAGCQAP